MKKLILFAAVVFAAATSCRTKYSAVYAEKPPIIDRPSYAIFIEVVDECEYLVIDGSYSGGLVHKQNCKNPIHK